MLLFLLYWPIYNCRVYNIIAEDTTALLITAGDNSLFAVTMMSLEMAKGLHAGG